MKFDHHRAAGDTWGVAGNPSAPEAIWKLKVCTQDRAPGRCVCIHSSCITTALPALSEEMCWGQQGSTAISSSSYLTRAFSGTTLQGVASQDCLDWERDVLPPVLFRTPLCSEICPQTTRLFWVPHHSNFFPFPSTPNLHYLLSTSDSFFSIPWHFILAQRAAVSSGATALHKRDCPKMQLLCRVLQAEVTLCHTPKTSTHNNRITEYITVPYSPTGSSANAYVHKLFTGWLSNTLCLNFISVPTSLSQLQQTVRKLWPLPPRATTHRNVRQEKVFLSIVRKESAVLPWETSWAWCSKKVTGPRSLSASPPNTEPQQQICIYSDCPSGSVLYGCCIRSLGECNTCHIFMYTMIQYVQITSAHVLAWDFWRSAILAGTSARD